ARLPVRFVCRSQVGKRGPTAMQILPLRTPQPIPRLLKCSEVVKALHSNLAAKKTRGLGRFFFALRLLLFLLAAATGLRADTITGTIKDPSGAVVAGARIEITGG